MITNIPDWDFPTNGAQYPGDDEGCVAEDGPCWCDDCHDTPLNLERKDEK